MAARTSGRKTEAAGPSAYDKHFEQHLANHIIYLHGRMSKPNNGRPDLRRRRPSLSPSSFPDDAFERFQQEHHHIGSEDDVMRKIIPVLAGTGNIPNSGGVLFNNLISMTGGDTTNVKPDFYDGVCLADMDQAVQNSLDRLIIPSTTNAMHRPAAPNIFLEARPRGEPSTSGNGRPASTVPSARVQCGPSRATTRKSPGSMAMRMPSARPTTPAPAPSTSTLTMSRSPRCPEGLGDETMARKDRTVGGHGTRPMYGVPKIARYTPRP